MKMEKVKGMAMAMIPIALGVAAGMLLYDQAKKATAGTSSFSNALGGGGGSGCTNKLHSKCNYVNTNGVCSYGCVSSSACAACSYGENVVGAGEGNILKPRTTYSSKLSRKFG